jgi:hypothetical protein
MEIETGPDESSGLEGLWSPSPSSASGAKHPKQPIGTAQDALRELLSPEPGCHSQEQNKGQEREGRGGRERTDYHKEAAINARPNRAAKERRPWAPKKIPPKSSKSGARLISNRRRIPGLGRASAVSEPCAYMEPMDRTKTQWPVSVRAPQGRIHGAAAAGGGRRKRCWWGERPRERRPVDPGPGGGGGGLWGIKQRRGGFGKKS